MTRSSDEARAVARVRENLRQLGRQPVPLASAELARERAERGVAHLTVALEKARQRRERNIRTRAILLAAAAIALGLVGAQSLLDRADTASAPLAAHGPSGSEEATLEPALQGAARDHLILRRDDTVRLVEGLAALRAGDVVETTQGSGQASLQGITRVELHTDTRLAVLMATPSEQVLRLHRGTGVFHVDPARHARVVIETDDARVLVTGTRFSVTTGANAAGSWTTVDVASGSVLVENAERSLRLDAGARWSSHTPATDLPAPTARRATNADFQAPSAPATSARTESARTESTRTESTHTSPPRTPTARATADSASSHAESSRTDSSRTESSRPDSSSAKPTGAKPARASAAKERVGKETEGTLAEENALLQGALTARKQGSSARCVTLLDRLVTRHPRSPLRHEALVLRFRCLRDGGDLSRARRAAQRYLDDYPNGAARDEANTLLFDR